MNITIMSDIMFPKGEKSIYAGATIQEIFDDSICEKILSSDVNVVNLECVLTKSETPITKWGSVLGAAPENVSFLKQIPNLLVNLSNNHAFDYGLQGLRDTIKVLKENGIKYFGACLDNVDESAICIDKNGEKIGFYTCSEHEFNGDSDGNGATLFEPMKAVLDIGKLSNECDRVVVLYHGGVEFYPYPYPGQQKNLRHMVDAGADLVVCQHNHFVSSEEQYGKGTIVYGQGTLIWGNRPEIRDNIQSMDMMNSGMLLSYDTKEGTLGRMFYHIDGDKIKVTADRELEEGYFSRSGNLRKEGFVRNEWMRYCKEHIGIMSVFGDTFVKRSKSRIFKDAIKALVGRSEDNTLRIYDYLSCESHLQLMQTVSRIKKDEM